ncbi:MAG: SPASM domain-containing protein [Helicobacteraceae bacterium]|nr:SPASM domain-containing protein [Helicobacteraceae bacterium]
MGNIHLSSLNEIWNNSHYLTLREENLSGIFNKCIACIECETRKVFSIDEDESAVNLGLRKFFVFNKDENK